MLAQAFQIKNEYARFSKYLPAVKVEVFYGGVPVAQNKAAIKNNSPHIIVGTPGRILGLVKGKDLNLGKLQRPTTVAIFVIPLVFEIG